jgi:hypothetical protein
VPLPGFGERANKAACVQIGIFPMPFRRTAATVGPESSSSLYPRRQIKIVPFLNTLFQSELGDHEALLSRFLVDKARGHSESR